MCHVCLVRANNVHTRVQQQINQEGVQHKATVLNCACSKIHVRHYIMHYNIHRGVLLGVCIVRIILCVHVQYNECVTRTYVCTYVHGD